MLMRVFYFKQKAFLHDYAIMAALSNRNIDFFVVSNLLNHFAS